MTDFAALDRYVQDRLPTWTDELIELCRFPSEATDLEALRVAADWTADRLLRLGAKVEIVRLPEKPDVPPLVVGEIGEGPRTVNLVQHYDVQPAHPLELWQSPPYEPVIRDGRLYARGATDNKGELMARIWGIEAYLATAGALPCRVRFLVEGEEESGSKNIGPLLDTRRELRRADAALIEGGGIDPTDRPFPGLWRQGASLMVELLVRSLRSDVHSSVASVIENSAARLVAALATLRDPRGAVALDGFLDDVRAPSDADRAHVRALPTDDLEELRSAYGAVHFLMGREGADALEAIAFEPTANLQAIWAGYTGPGIKNVVPAEARARLDLRLVPDQSPERVEAALRAHLDRRGFDDVQIQHIDGSRAWWTSMEHPVVRAAQTASEAVLGHKAMITPSMPGSAPMWEVCSRDDVPNVSLGAGRTDCMAHAPNENYRLSDAAIAARITARFLDEFAALE